MTSRTTADRLARAASFFARPRVMGIVAVFAALFVLGSWAYGPVRSAWTNVLALALFLAINALADRAIARIDARDEERR